MRLIAYAGSKLTISCARLRDGTCPASDFLEQLPEREGAKMLAMFKWLGDLGWINNKERFKPIQGTDFFEFKNHQIRMPCFRSENHMVITHGFMKKQDRIPREEIDRAIRIRSEDERGLAKHSKGR